MSGRDHQEDLIAELYTEREIVHRARTCQAIPCDATFENELGNLETRVSQHDAQSTGDFPRRTTPRTESGASSCRHVDHLKNQSFGAIFHLALLFPT